MDRGGYAGESFEQAGAGGVEELVGDAEDAALADSTEMVPVALGDDFFEWNAVSGSAPGEYEDIGIHCSYGFGGGVRTGLAQESTSRGLYQFGDPMLGVDKRLAPFFAVDDWGVGSCERLLAGHLDGGCQACDEGLAFAVGVDYRCDEANVFADVVEIVGSEGEDGQTGFQDRGERLHAIRNAGYD